MKQIEKIAESENFSAIGLGKLSELNEFVLELNPAVKIPGKVFGGRALQTTGAEFSFQSFAPGTETGFLHTHKTHEELYFFLSGEGEFQVDGKIFPIGEGSIVRVAPAGGVPSAIRAARRLSCYAYSTRAAPLRPRTLPTV